MLADARRSVRDQASRLGVATCPPRGLRRRQAALVLDCSADRQGLKTAITATAPDGICRCAGTLHASASIPTTRMFGRNTTLVVGRSHARSLMPAVLDLVATGKLHPEMITTTVASFDDAPRALTEHIQGDFTKTMLVAPR